MLHLARRNASTSSITNTSRIISNRIGSSLRAYSAANTIGASSTSHSHVLATPTTTACTFQQHQSYMRIKRSNYDNWLLSHGNAQQRFRSFSSVSASTSTSGSASPLSATSSFSQIDPIAWSPSLGLYGCELRQPSDFSRLEQSLRERCDILLNEMKSTPVTLAHLAHTDAINNYVCCVMSATLLISQTHPSHEWRDAAIKTSQSLGQYVNEMNHSPIMYHSLSSLCSHPDFTAWNEETQRVATLLKRDMDVHGIGSSENDRELINQTLSLIQQAQSNFSIAQNSEHTDRRTASLSIDNEDMRYLQPELRNPTWSNDDGRTVSFRLALVPSLLPWMHLEKWRKMIYLYYNSKEAIGAQGTALIELIQARSQLVRILGKSSYTDHTLEDKVAGSASHVRQLLLNLIESLQPQVNEKTKQEVMNIKFEKWIHEKEMKLTASSPSLSPLPFSLDSLTAEQLSEVNSTQVHEWDRSYYIVRAKQRAAATKNVSAESAATNDIVAQFAQYFTLTNVLQGLTILSDKLFGLTLKRVKLEPGESPFMSSAGSTNESEIQYSDDELIKLELWENDSTTHQRKLLGVIYLDLYERPNKYPSGVAMTVRCGATVGEMKMKRQQIPVTTIVTAMSRPAQYDEVHPHQTSSSSSSSTSITSSQHLSLFHLREVETMFHEFGHSLQNLLSATQYQRATGMLAQPDFVELLSTFMEYFIEDHTFVQMWAKHYSTNEPIPSSLLTSAFATKNLFSNTGKIEQCLSTLFDQMIHGPGAQLVKADEWSPVLNATFHSLHQQYSPFYHADEDTRSGSIRSSEPYLRYYHFVSYGAGYYSYLYCSIFARCIWEKSEIGRNNVTKGPNQSADFDDAKYKRLGEKLRYQYLMHGIGKNPRTILADLVDLDLTESTSSPNQSLSEPEKAKQQMKKLHTFVEQHVGHLVKKATVSE